MLFYLFVTFQVIYSVSCYISCYNCPFETNNFDYLITADNVPTELTNCTLQKNIVSCSIEIEWQRGPNNTKITLVADNNTDSVSTAHVLTVDVGFENERATLQWKKVLIYKCATDQCNSLVHLKRLLNSLIMSDTLNYIAYILQPAESFQGRWCHRQSNATFEECDINIPDSSCKQCSLSGIMNQTRLELCATCLVDKADKTSLAYGMNFNMSDRTRSSFWDITCESEECNAPFISDRIRENTQFDFDFVKFLNVGNGLTSLSTVGKMALIFIVFIVKLLN